jgi:hypothetical protein
MMADMQTEYGHQILRLYDTVNREVQKTAHNYKNSILSLRNRLETIKPDTSLEAQIALDTNLHDLYSYTASAAALKMWAGMEAWALLGVTGLFALLPLFLDGKVASALIRWSGGSVDIKGSSKSVGSEPARRRGGGQPGSAQ